MIIQNIGTRALSMYIDSKELDEMGFRPDEIGQQEAGQLLRRALGDNTLKQWKAAEMEVYPGKDSILLFVRRKSTKPFHFIFDDFEALISASKFSKELPSSLVALDGGYLLTVYPLEGDCPPATLSEFGNPIDLSPYLSIHYEEQGKYIFMQQAMSEIRRLFR